MASSNLIRWSGLASMGGGVLLIVSDFLELLLAGYELDEAASTGTYVGVTGLTLLGTVLLLVGLVGLYIGQPQAANLLGLVGFLVCFLGNALVAGAVWEATFVVPWLAWRGPRASGRRAHGVVSLGLRLVIHACWGGRDLVRGGHDKSSGLSKGGRSTADNRGDARRGVELPAAA